MTDRQRMGGHIARLERQARQQREAIIAEFGGMADAAETMHQTAAEIIRLRDGAAILAKAIEFLRGGSSFALIPPGPYGGTHDRSLRLSDADISSPETTADGGRAT